MMGWRRKIFTTECAEIAEKNDRPVILWLDHRIHKNIRYMDSVVKPQNDEQRVVIREIAETTTSSPILSASSAHSVVKFLVVSLLIFLPFRSFSVVNADVKSISGENINFDLDNDGTVQMKLTADGLRVGSGDDPSGNVHVSGVTIVSDNIYIATTAGNSSIQVENSIGFSIERITTNTTLSGNSVIFADTSSNDITIIIPSASVAAGRIYMIKKISALNTVTVYSDGAQVDGNSEVKLTSTTDGSLPLIEVISDGSNWNTLSLSGNGNVLDLIGWWKFDDSSGNIATDSSSNGYSGNLSDTMTFDGNTVTGITGNALVFDGTNDYINLEDLNGELDGITSFTISAWIYVLDQSVNYRQFIGKKLDNSHRVAFGLHTANDKDIWLNVADGQDSKGRTVNDYISNETWYHVVMVYDGSGAANADRLKGYIDGKGRTLNFANTVPAATDVNDADLKIGESMTAWIGYVDDLKIYRNALSAAEVNLLYKSYFTSDNLIGHWKFDDDSGTTATDESAAGNPSGNGNNGALMGGLDFSTNVISGISGNALVFDGTDDDVHMYDVQSDMDGLSEFTISAWVYKLAATNWEVILAKRLNDSSKVTIRLAGTVQGSNDLQFFVNTGTNLRGDTTGDYISNNTWYHIVAVYNGNGASSAAGMQLYIDGIQRTLSYTGTLPTDSPSNEANMTIGSRSNVSDFWNGYIDEVKIYDYPLSAGEVKSLYNSYLPNSGTGSTANLIGWWKFDDDSGTTAIDSANANHPGGIGNDGTLSGGLDFSTNVVAGISGNALVLDDIDDRVDYNDLNSDLDGIKEFTISVLIYGNDYTTDNRSIFTKRADANNKILLITDYGDNDLYLAVADDTNPKGVTTGDQITVGKWHHVVMVYNGNGAANADRLKCYVDSDEKTLTFSLTIPAQTDSNDADGETGDGSLAPWNGYIDDLRIYDYPLSAGEVTSLYNSYLPNSGTGATANLIAWWKFDDDSGTTAIDSANANHLAGIGNDGTLGGGLDFSTNSITGVSGNALSLDSSNDNIDFNDIQSDLDALTEFSISILAYSPSNPGENDTIFSKYTSTSQRVEIGTADSLSTDEDVWFAVANGAVSYAYTSSAKFKELQWHHIVAVFNGNGATNADRCKIYIDGVEQSMTFASTTPSILASDDADVVIGSKSDGTAYFDGYVDDTIIYDYPLSAANVSELYASYTPSGSSSNLIAHWAFDDDSGTTATDSANVYKLGYNSFDGTLSGTFDFSSNVMSGVSGNALTFEGTDDVIDLTSHISSFSGMNEGTVSLWFKKSSTARTGLITLHDISETDRFVIECESATGSVRVIVRNGNSNVLEMVSTNSFTDNKWHHVVFTQNGTKAKLFVDAEVVSLSTSDNSSEFFNDVANLDTMYIGLDDFSNNNLYHDGHLDEVKVYDYALPASNVLAQYQAAMPNGSSNLLAHWKFDDSSGTNATDSANIYRPAYDGHDGTLAGGHDFSSNVVSSFDSGTALVFNGSSDYIELGTLPTQIANLNEGTISFWFKTSSTATGGFFVINDISETDRFGIWLNAYNTGKVRTIVRNGASNQVELVTEDAYNDDRWHHVVYAQNGTKSKLFVDGVVVDLGTSDNSGEFINDIANLDTWRIGLDDYSNNNQYYDGQMDDMKLYDYALPSSNVLAVYQSKLPANSSSNLMSWWKLDDDSGTNATDSGNVYEPNYDGNDGTLTGGHDFSSNVATGFITGNALTFDGTDDNINLNSHLANYKNMNEGSFSFWFKTSSDQRGGFLTLNDASETDRFVCEINTQDSGGNIRIIGREGSTNVLDIQTTHGYNDDEWHYVVFTQDGTNSSLYIDGQIPSLFTSDNSGEFFNDVSNLDEMYWGLDNGSGGAKYFDGQMDDLKIYDHALSAANIRNQFSAAGNQSLALAAHWTLDETSGTNADDSSTHNRDGTLSNFNFSTNTVSGNISNALSFDGTDDFITTSGTNGMITNNSFSVAFWVKDEGTSDVSGILGKYEEPYGNDDTANDWTVGINSSAAGGTGDPPILVSVGATKDGTGAVTPVWPTHQTDDIGILIVEVEGGGSCTLSSAQGFAEITRSGAAEPSSGDQSCEVVVFWVRATSSSMNNPTIGDSGDHNIARILVFRNCPTTGNPWDVTAIGTEAPTLDTSLSIGALTTTVGGTQILYCAAGGNDSATPLLNGNTPTNATLGTISTIFDYGTTINNVGGQICAFSGNMTGSGDTGSLTSTVTNSLKAWVVVALKSTTSSAGGSGNLNMVMSDATGSSNVAVGALNPTLNEWNHVGFTYDGSTVKSYANGAEVQSSSFTADMGDEYDFRFSGNTSGYFKGSLDDVRIYNRSLSADEMQNLYLLGD